MNRPQTLKSIDEPASDFKINLKPASGFEMHLRTGLRL
jgi:hypothetical protein